MEEKIIVLIVALSPMMHNAYRNTLIHIVNDDAIVSLPKMSECPRA